MFSRWGLELAVKSLEDLDTLVGAVPFAIVQGLRTIDTGRGSEALYRDKLPGLLTSLADRARVAGYRAALDYLYQDQWRPLNLGLILHLHRLLFSVHGGSRRAVQAGREPCRGQDA
jgi:hypothetical protein